MKTFTISRKYRERYDKVSRLLIGLSAEKRPVVLPEPFGLEPDSGLTEDGAVIDRVSIEARGIALSGKGRDGGTVIIGAEDYLFPDVFDAVCDELVSQLESLRRVWVVRTLSDENYGNEIKHIPRVLWKQGIVPGFHESQAEVKGAMFSAIHEHVLSALPHVDVRTEYEPDGSIRYLVDSDHTGIPKKVYWTDYEIVKKDSEK